MRQHGIVCTGLLIWIATVLQACSGSKVTDPAEPAFSVQLFSAGSPQIDNPFLPLVPETVQLYFVETADSSEIIVVEVLARTRLVNGVTCAVVRDRVYEDELLLEDTHDWFAQDDSGNVWYMGEEVINYEYDDQGVVIGTDSAGAWEAGVDGAEPGILMKADPRPGDTYRQEFYAGEAEDMGAIVARNVAVTLADGSTYSCLQTRDWTPLEPGVEEFKYYAAGVGKVLEEKTDGSDRGELKGTFFLGPGSLPDFAAATFANPAVITNTYLPFAVGNTWDYEKDTDEGLETILVEVLATTRTVMGIECAVVRDRVFLDGTLIEDTHDWYAQDDLGNVWYMGEDVVNYEYDDMGVLVDTNNDGAWEAGVDGAEPGIVMWASPAVGQSYRQEFYEDEAEDMALVVARSVTVELSDGTTYPNCLKNLEWTPLDPAALEYKYYAPGVGVVKEEPAGGGDAAELTSGP